MMLQLDFDNYAKLGALFQPLRNNLVVDSILVGNTPAWVFADRLEQPSLGLMWNRQDAILLSGDPSDAEAATLAGRVIRDRIVSEARARRIPELALFYAPAGWEAHVDTVLPGLNAHRTPRRYYHFDRLRLNWRAALPPGLQVHPIDLPFLEGSSLTNHNQVTGWVLSFWASPVDFVERGFGYYVASNSTAVSWCLTVYAAGSDVEFGVATSSEFRRRGYATLAAAACLEHSQSLNLRPHWQCWEENQASMAVAQKIGFARPVRFPVFRFGVPGE